jgi:hypothetical protein
MSLNFHKRIIATLEEMAKTKPPGYSNKVDRELGLIFVYQTIQKWASSKLKDSISKYLKDNNISSDHNDYDSRRYIVANGNNFYLCLDISNPRRTLSKEALRLILMREFNINNERCQELFEEATIPGVKAITKTVIIKD